MFPSHDREERILKVFGPEELREFLKDVYVLAHQDYKNVGELEGDDKKWWLTETASLLSKFAEKHSERLKKIRRYDGLQEDLEKLEAGKAALESGAFRI